MPTAVPETRLLVKVVPGGSRDAILGLHGDRIRVKVTAAPEGGKANRAVLGLLAERLGLPVSALRIVQGETKPLKTVALRGIDRDAALAALLRDGPA